MLRYLKAMRLERKLDRLISEKVALENEQADPRFTTIGLITVAWAKLEGSLDMINDEAFSLGGNRFERQLPQNLKRKLRFMSRCHRDLPELASVQESAEAVIAKVRELMERRHDIIHGIALEFPAGEIMDFVRFNYSEKGLGVTSLQLRSADLFKLLRDTMSTFDLADDHFFAMTDAINMHGPDDGSSNLAD